MSARDVIREVQRALGVTDDGIPLARTDAAYQAAKLSALAQWRGEQTVATAPALVNPPFSSGGLVDARSESNIATLHRLVQPHARELIRQAVAAGIDCRIIDGSRTYAQQDSLFEQGRTRPGRIVTNARGGQSNHCFGLAFDVGCFDAAGKYLDDSPLYRHVGQIGKALGFQWGGDWTGIVDEPHHQFPPPWAAGISQSAMLTELRRRHDAGIDAFA